ncbi:MAG: hypothetical protein JW709_03115 [Sedimentisphaerales bacterium]|nr:hypothetical protein [Sedimentisphaerales bacterium]
MLKKEYDAGHNEGSHAQNSIGIRKILGLVLIIGGVVIALWVFLNVYSLFTEPDRLTPFQELVSGQLEAKINYANQEETKVEIPAEFLSYLVPLILLAIAVKIAGSFLSSGVRLLTKQNIK